MSTMIYLRKRFEFDNQDRITLDKEPRDYFDIPEGYRIKGVKRKLDSEGLTMIAKLVPEKNTENATANENKE